MVANLELRLTGGATNSDPNLSLGGDSSSEAVSATPSNSIFDDVVPNEAWTGDTEYRALSLHNKGDEEADAIELHIASETDSPDSVIAIGKDAGTQSIANEDTPPSSPEITFSHPLVDSKMSISNLAAGAAQRLWFRRTIKELAAYHANDLFSLKADYDTVTPPPPPPFWESKFGLPYWVCHANCSWDGTKYVEAGPGMTLQTTGVWPVGYRPAKMKITGAPGGSDPGKLHLKDIANNTLMQDLAYSSGKAVFITWYNRDDMWRLDGHHFSTITAIEFGGEALQGTDATKSQCSASSEYSVSYTAVEAWDGIANQGTTNSWISTNVNGPNPDGSCWLQWDFPAAKDIIAMHFRLRGDGGQDAWPSNIRVLGSNTGAFSGEEAILFDDDVPNASLLTPGDWTDWIEFTANGSYFYYRMEIHERYVFDAGADWVAVQEVEFATN